MSFYDRGVKVCSTTTGDERIRSLLSLLREADDAPAKVVEVDKRLSELSNLTAELRETQRCVRMKDADITGLHTTIVELHKVIADQRCVRRSEIKAWGIERALYGPTDWAKNIDFRDLVHETVRRAGYEPILHKSLQSDLLIKTALWIGFSPWCFLKVVSTKASDSEYLVAKRHGELYPQFKFDII